jgi:hypothetical protein
MSDLLVLAAHNEPRALMVHDTISEIYTQQFLSVYLFKLCGPTSDLWAHNALQAETSLHTWSTVTFENGPLNQNASKQKLQKNNRHICVSCISSLASAAQITFETYN